MVLPCQVNTEDGENSRTNSGMLKKVIPGISQRTSADPGF